MTGFANVVVVQSVRWHDPDRILDAWLPVGFSWMAPLADLLFFLVATCILALLSLLMPRLRRPRAVVRTLTFLLSASLFSFAFHLAQIRLFAPAAVLLAGGLAVFCSRIAGRWPRQSLAAAHRLGRLLALFWIGLFGISCSWGWWRAANATAGLPQARPGAANAILVSLDTVRAKGLRLYGGEGVETPRLAQLARQGVLFDHALATSPWTLPSHATMLTGQYPHRLSTDFQRRLDQRYPTLAEVLQQAGYQTAGFVGNSIYCGRASGLDRGFRHYEDYPSTVFTPLFCSTLTFFCLDRLLGDRLFTCGALRATASEVNQKLFRWLRGRDRGRPFFAFVNYFDAHDPYVLPEPHASRYQPYSRRVTSWLLNKNNSQLDTGSGSPDMRTMQRAYDDVLPYLDEQLGLLVDELEREGLRDTTVIIVTSDHGEQFGEHDLAFHANSLYRTLLEVPLVIVYPGYLPAGRRVPTPVSLRSLAATVIDLLGVEANHRVPGQTLAPLWQGKPSPARDPLLAMVTKSVEEFDLGPNYHGAMRSVVAEGFHLIHNEGTGSWELFDWERDPEESRDLATAPGHGEILMRLKQQLATMNQ
jgi:arylsulfatase A-like enzyme